MNPILNKKVSVIIPNYNAQNYIEECLDSVLTQDYPDIEIIVIDDGSTDNSLKRIEPYLEKITLITQKNQGACVARNAGLKVASGEYIKFLDSDDYLAPGIIASQVNKLNTLDDLSIVFGDLIEIHHSKSILRDYSKINPTPTIETLILNGLITSLPLHRKKLLLEINGFDPRFKNWQEWNLHIRLASIGTKFIHQPEIVYYRRFHDNPDRISNNYRVEPEYEINKRTMTLNSIEELTKNTSSSINSAMSYSLWLIARDYYISNHPKAAIQCYDAAYKISSNINTYLPIRYKLISFFIGNKKMEHLILLRKKFTKFRKRLFSL